MNLRKDHYHYLFSGIAMSCIFLGRVVSLFFSKQNKLFVSQTSLLSSLFAIGGVSSQQTLPFVVPWTYFMNFCKICEVSLRISFCVGQFHVFFGDCFSRLSLIKTSLSLAAVCVAQQSLPVNSPACLR